MTVAPMILGASAFCGLDLENNTCKPTSCVRTFQLMDYATKGYDFLLLKWIFQFKINVWNTYVIIAHSLK